MAFLWDQNSIDDDDDDDYYYYVNTIYKYIYTNMYIIVFTDLQVLKVFFSNTDCCSFKADVILTTSSSFVAPTMTFLCKYQKQSPARSLQWLQCHCTSC